MEEERVKVDLGALEVARELRRPLSLIRQMALGIDVQDSALVRDYTATTVRISEQATRQIDNLMKVVEMRGAMFEMEPVVVRKVCDEAMFGLIGLNGSERIVVRYRNRQGKLAMANRELLREMVYNFCVSALRSNEEKVFLTVRDAESRIRIEMRDFGALNESMRVGSAVPMFLIQQFAEMMNGKMGTIRHRDGMSVYVDFVKVEQMSLL
jgi:signal transduction histidine kinase